MSGQLRGRVFRTRSQKLGGHYHVRVFAADRPDHTFANIGTLVMDESDYASFVAAFKADHLPGAQP